jgi:hypothetical protein
VNLVYLYASICHICFELQGCSKNKPTIKQGCLQSVILGKVSFTFGKGSMYQHPVRPGIWSGQMVTPAKFFPSVFFGTRQCFWGLPTVVHVHTAMFLVFAGCRQKCTRQKALKFSVCLGNTLGKPFATWLLRLRRLPVKSLFFADRGKKALGKLFAEFRSKYTRQISSEANTLGKKGLPR